MSQLILIIHLYICIIVIIIINIYIYNSGHTQPQSRNFKSVGERLACEAMETILGREIVVNSRPDCLRNPKTGRCLEYDGYDPVTHVAIDYNGPQHYEWPNRYHQTEQEFKDQLARDALKLNLSEKAGITLICIPYTVDCPIKNVYPPHPVRYERLLVYLKNHIDEHNISTRSPGPHSGRGSNQCS